MKVINSNLIAKAGGRLLGGKNHFPPKKIFPPRTFWAIIPNLHIFPGGKKVKSSYIKVQHTLASKIWFLDHSGNFPPDVAEKFSTK